MKLAIMQPYFMPYIGYWQLIKAVDTYVVFDDVNYINKGWINRNRLLINGQDHLFTISLRNASQNRLINEIDIADDFSKLKKQIEFAYKKAPFFQSLVQLMGPIFDYPEKNLAEFLFNSIKIVCNYLDIKTNLVKSSNVEKNDSLHAESKILNICKVLKAKKYLNAIGGQSLYHRDVFQSNGVELNFLKSNLIPYKQFENDFIAGLSIIDVMMFNSVSKIRTMLDEYELI